MYNIYMTSWGGTSKTFIGEVSLEEATEICESFNWTYEDGGYIWDLEIEEIEEG